MGWVGGWRQVVRGVGGRWGGRKGQGCQGLGKRQEWGRGVWMVESAVPLEWRKGERAKGQPASQHRPPTPLPHFPHCTHCTAPSTHCTPAGRSAPAARARAPGAPRGAGRAPGCLRPVGAVGRGATQCNVSMFRWAGVSREGRQAVGWHRGTIEPPLHHHPTPHAPPTKPSHSAAQRSAAQRTRGRGRPRVVDERRVGGQPVLDVDGGLHCAACRGVVCGCVWGVWGVCCWLCEGEGSAAPESPIPAPTTPPSSLPRTWRGGDAARHGDAALPAVHVDKGGGPAPRPHRVVEQDLAQR